MNIIHYKLYIQCFDMRAIIKYVHGMIFVSVSQFIQLYRREMRM